MNRMNLKELREQRGISREELSNLLGVSLSAIGMYERGERIPRYWIMQKISELFSVPLGNIFFGSK